jgi:fatty-acyl-CoA synthase
VGRFEGYTDSSASEKKILRDVFERGDSYYRTGDLLSRDREGYYYFVDRIGDTFRWKGENVATSEVAEILSVYDGIKEANVYGVRIPGADGRAGMAALVCGDGLDFKGFYRYVDERLPSYARPLFLRIEEEIAITGTFKHRKVDLVREGFDITAVSEPLYFRDDASATFVPIDTELYRRLTAGEISV